MSGCCVASPNRHNRIEVAAFAQGEIDCTHGILNVKGVKYHMKARHYRLGQRQATVEQTRARIIAAARELLAAPDSFSGFTMDAVAAHAGVARMTVFNQFRSKRGLLEALFDDLAARGLLKHIQGAFMQADPRQALDVLVAAFGGFWTSDRLVIRRIRGLASIDADFASAVSARDERRREAIRTILGRFTSKRPRRSAVRLDEVVAVLHTLTSFETFDNLAGLDRDPDEVVSLICRLVWAAIELSSR
jgi:AcrR family transcriptional regulator